MTDSSLVDSSLVDSSLVDSSSSVFSIVDLSLFDSSVVCSSVTCFSVTDSSLLDFSSFPLDAVGSLMTGCAHIASHICVKRGIDKNLPLARQWARY